MAKKKDHPLLTSLREVQQTLDALIAAAPNKTAVQKKARQQLMARRDGVISTCDALVGKQFTASAEKVAAAQLAVGTLSTKLKATKATLTGLADAATLAGDILATCTGLVAAVL